LVAAKFPRARPKYIGLSAVNIFMTAKPSLLHPAEFLPPRSRRRRLLARGALCALAVAGSLVYALFNSLNASSEAVIFKVSRGSGMSRIAGDLQAAGLVSNKYLFMLAVLLQGSEASLKAGAYSLNPGLSPWRLAETIKQGRTILYKAALPEGLTMAQIIERLAAPSPLAEGQGSERAWLTDKREALALAEDADFIKSLDIAAPSLEGYLFPETYFFGEESVPARQVLTIMVEKFKREWDSIPPGSGNNRLNRHQLVTLASIIEKETGVDAERPLVSAVYHNRLLLGMPLQADPTVVYGLENPSAITRRQLRRDHSYNTYTRPGLPPGPICSPGRASLQAACHPAAVDYLYFVASSANDGSHNFASSYQEHLRNVAAYRNRLRR
jgi:UPF0755 protein